jgi:hypothetical protein
MKENYKSFLVRFQVLRAASVKFTDVSEVLAANTGAMNHSSMNSTRLHGATFQKTVIFKVWSG